MNDSFALELFKNGYTDLISVSPPNAQLSPGSKITASQLGKVPAIRLQTGLWRGYDWRKYETQETDVRRWELAGANIGLRAGRFPAIDVDVTDTDLALEIEKWALETLGPAPVRIGRAPKRLLMYRASVPFARMRLIVHGDGITYMIEALGEGQQYLVKGIHSITKQPYQWLGPVPPAEQLTDINAEAVSRFFDRVAAELGPRGFEVIREGEGRIGERAEVDQEGLRAPSDAALEQAVSLIPNDDNFATRESYIKFGYAIRAACADEETGFAIFERWANRWTAGVNEPDTLRTDWRRMHGPYAIGWSYILELARGHGYTDAADVFAGVPAPLSDPQEPGVDLPAPEQVGVRLSDRWLSDTVAEMLGGRLRSMPATGEWLVWDGGRWRVDDLNLAMAEVSDALHAIAIKHVGIGDGAKKREAEAKAVESAHTLSAVMRMLSSNRGLALPVEALDRDIWLLNTPAGTVDLRTGDIRAAQPTDLITKSTLVGPDFHSPAPAWTKFIREATGGDAELEAFLQRYIGYSLTGDTREQVLVFIYGGSGAGKGTFLTAVRSIFGTYVTNAPMTFFTKGRSDSHPTDLASLMGARLITASETERGKAWDPIRIKNLTGGDPITARKMRQDYFTFRPQGKLCFIGNYEPVVHDMDAAIRRRLLIVPFTHIVPFEQMDHALEDKLIEEYPQILAWMIRGALEWQRIGLAPPQSVKAPTEEYFEEEDAITTWVREYLDPVPSATTELATLFDSWREWCNRYNRLVAGRPQDLMRDLMSRGYKRGPRSAAGRATVQGLQVRQEWV